MRFFIARAALVSLVTMAGIIPARAQARPRIGLVLSGGGAGGFAHVGVIEVLEELRVPVDVVAGTSMGAIVGGLYSAGYAPAELEGVVSSLDWRELILDRPDRRRIPYRRKVDDQTYLTRYELGLSGAKLLMPSGFVSGHRLGVALRVLSLRAAGTTDFDNLPRPFRAVATDLGTGDMVVLAKGDLATALRASMAVPGVFSPVEVNGRLLADGGLVRNLPVDLARAMGVDIVIAVDLGQPLASMDRPDSIATVLERTTGMLMRMNVEKSLGDADVVIRPAVSQYGLLDFSRWREILPRGREATRAVAGRLAGLALSEQEWSSYLACRRVAPQPLRIAEVSVDPGKGQPPELVARLVHTRPGQTLDVKLLQADVERLYEVGEFETVDFRLTPVTNGWALAIMARPKSWGPNFLRFGLALTADLEGSSSFNGLSNLTMTHINRLGGELKTAVQVGGSPLVAGELYQPFESSRTVFGAVELTTSQIKQQVPVGAGSVQYRIALTRAALSLGLQLGRFGEVRAGVRQDVTKAVPTSQHGSDAKDVSRTDAGYVLRAALDQMDNLSFPRRGLLAFVEAYDARRALGADVEYRRLDVTIFGAATRGRSTLIGFGRATSALGGALPFGQEARLGGLFNMSGLPPGEVIGSYGGVGGLIYLYRLGRMPNFGQGIYAGVSVEAGNMWSNRRDVSLSDLRHSFSIALGLDTVLGPVYFAQGFTSGGKDSFYFLLGRTF